MVAALLFHSLAATGVSQDSDESTEKTPLQQLTEEADLLLLGTIETPAQHLRTLCGLSQVENDGWTGKSISLDQRNALVPISNIEKDGREWVFEFAQTKAVFRGVEAEDRSIGGTFEQNGVKFPLTFRVVDAVPPPPSDETWIGELNAIVLKMTLQFRLVGLTQDGETTTAKVAYFDSLTEGFTSFLGEYTRTGEKVVFEVPVLKARFQGELSEGGDVVKGTFTQNFIPLPLTLKKVALPAEKSAKPRRRQTPGGKPKYREITFSHANPEAPGVQLAGTITLPEGDGKVPAVILVSGSGPQDRDETIMEHKPFAVLADYLTKRGIAVFRYDDRGVGKSSGEFAEATFDDLASDAEAVLHYARVHPRVDASSVGILGHSEGGMIAPFVAAKIPETAFVIMLAAPGVDGARTLVLQSDRLLELSGVSEEERRRDSEMRDKLHKLALSRIEQNDALEPVKAILREYSAKQGSDAVDEEKLEQSAKQFLPLFSPWMIRFLEYDPSDQITEVNCPILGLWGGKDVQVLAEENREALEVALVASSKTNFEFKTFEGLNHLFQPAETGMVCEYALIDTTISPIVLEEIFGFIQKATGEKLSTNRPIK